MLNPTEHIIQIASEYYNGKVNRSFIVYAMSMKFILLYDDCSSLITEKDHLNS